VDGLISTYIFLFVLSPSPFFFSPYFRYTNNEQPFCFFIRYFITQTTSKKNEQKFKAEKMIIKYM
jgi:hypothetical protein